MPKIKCEPNWENLRRRHREEIRELTFECYIHSTPGDIARELILAISGLLNTSQSLREVESIRQFFSGLCTVIADEKRQAASDYPLKTA